MKAPQTLVLVDPDRSLLDVAALVADLRELLGCNVDVVTEKGRDLLLVPCPKRASPYENAYQSLAGSA